MSNDKAVPTAYRSGGFGFSAVTIDHGRPDTQTRAARTLPLKAVTAATANIPVGGHPTGHSNISSVAA